MSREDCFGNNGSTCKALRVKKCKNCNFYKTQKKHDEDRKKSIARIKSLGKVTAIGFEEKYYKGRKVFSEV